MTALRTWWLNLGEDGALRWWLFVLRRCWRGHDWQDHHAYEGEGWHYEPDCYRDCRRCGTWGGRLHDVADIALASHDGPS